MGLNRLFYHCINGFDFFIVSYFQKIMKSLSDYCRVHIIFICAKIILLILISSWNLRVGDDDVVSVLFVVAPFYVWERFIAAR